MFFARISSTLIHSLYYNHEMRLLHINYMRVVYTDTVIYWFYRVGIRLFPFQFDGEKPYAVYRLEVFAKSSLIFTFLIKHVHTDRVVEKSLFIFCQRTIP